MKYLSFAILFVLLFIPSAAKADSFVFVDMVPVTSMCLCPAKITNHSIMDRYLWALHLCGTSRRMQFPTLM